MRLTILESKKVIYRANAKEVVLPGEDGELCVLDFHQPFLYSLREGLVKVLETGLELSERETKTPQATKQTIRIKNGLASMKGNELTVFTES